MEVRNDGDGVGKDIPIMYSMASHMIADDSELFSSGNDSTILLWDM